MSMLLVLLTIWGVLTTILIVLLIYRSTLTMHEDEQLFLDESSSAMAEEQRELVKRVNKLTPLIRVFGGASGALILVIAGIWLYQGLTAAQ
jgi:Tfp pilus assembly protein PilN